MYAFEPHRSHEQLLRNLLKPNAAYPSAILITDNVAPAYGAAFVSYALQQILDADNKGNGNVRLLRVSPVACPTLASLSSSLQRQLGQPPAGAHIDAAKLVAALTASLRKLQQDARIVLFIESAERMLEFWPPEMAEVLIRLDEYCACRGRLCVIMQSALPWTRFRTVSARSTSLVPLTIDLPALTWTDLVKFFSGEVDKIEIEEVVPWMTREMVITWFGRFWKIARDMFAGDVRDLEELRTLVLATWPVFCLPLQENRNMPFESLLSSQRGIFGEALASLGTRRMSPHEWIDAAKQRASPTARPVKRQRRCAPSDVGEAATSPALRAFILISAFLASYNPVRLDARYFQQTEADRAVRRRRGGKKAGKEDDLGESLDRPQLQGPRNFPLERLLAILESLLTSEEPPSLVEPGLKGDTDAWRALARSASTLTQINALVSSGELVQASASGGLDSVQYRVNVPYARVKSLSIAHGFELGERLWNWK